MDANGLSSIHKAYQAFSSTCISHHVCEKYSNVWCSESGKCVCKSKNLNLDLFATLRLNSLVVLYHHRLEINYSFLGGIQPQYDSDYHFWERNVWRPNLTFLASVLSKTVENQNFNKKLHNSYSEVRTQRTFYLTTKLIF